MLNVVIRNESEKKGLYRMDILRRIANRVCEGEGHTHPETEVSLLFCDDPFIAQLNGQYRGKWEPTDVLSFAQENNSFHGAHLLGDIVISLETVARNCDRDPDAMRREVRLLFCHGLLHLRGHEHGTPEGKAAMVAKQALYLRIQPEEAWRDRPAAPVPRAKVPAGGGVAKPRGK